MFHRRTMFVVLLLMIAGLSTGSTMATPAIPAASGAVPVLTRSYNNGRTGANLTEGVLTTSNVNVRSFGKRFARTVDGQIYAQPLYVPSLTFAGGVLHNVVFVATQHNSVYAFDADDPAQATPLWQVNLGPSAPVPSPDFGTRYGTFKNIHKEVGITSTPVIDLSSHSLYVVALIKLGPASYQHRLYALDLLTGAPKFGSPTIIQGSVAGMGAGSSGGTIAFTSQSQLQRPGLLLVNGTVYVAFASYADTPPYHGWVFAYDAATLQRRGLYNDTPDGGAGGIWQSGEGPAADTNGDAYLITGNGTSTPSSGKNLGTAFVKLHLGRGGLAATDWFMPYDQASLNRYDQDIGSSGAVLLPGTNVVVGGGKSGKLYVLDTTSLGHYHSGSDSQILQSFQVGAGHIHGTPVYWQGPSTAWLYLWSEQDVLKAFAFNATTRQFQTTPAMQGTVKLPKGMPGGILSVSANGTTSGSGILWATHPKGDALNATQPGILRAYDASNLAKELWNSDQNPGRDALGNFAKFNPPLVVNGKVYVGSFSDDASTVPDQLVVYGRVP